MSIRSRALLAALLLVGFYLLALGMAAGLAWVGYEAVVLRPSVATIKIALFCGVGAFLIVRAMLPRPDRFEAPGPRLARAEHPRLFAMVDEVAAQTGQAPPAEVYAIPEVNAWVAERGGTMGVGSRRVMGIGLPLVELLTVAELRAVIAHEFGHYVSGDTRLGPWIYRTRAAIVRTFQDLAGHSGLLAKPFEWYGTAFIRITHKVSRAQEFVADATAARVAGSDAASRALVRIAGGAGAYGAFWRSELAPALDAGFRPPLVAGFRAFLVAPSIAPQVAKLVDAQLASETTDPYDTHPCLRDRLHALEQLPPMAARFRADDDTPALGLLDQLERLEAATLAHVAPKARRTIAWEEVPGTVLAALWREQASAAAGSLAGLTPEMLPALLRDGPALTRRASRALPTGLPDEVRPVAAADVVACALALALTARAADQASGVRIESPLGEPLRFVARDGSAILPFRDCQQLREGAPEAPDDDAWRACCAASGILGVDLGAAVGGAAAPRASVGLGAVGRIARA